MFARLPFLSMYERKAKKGGGGQSLNPIAKLCTETLFAHER